MRDRIPLLLESDIVANVTYQSIMTLTTAARESPTRCPSTWSASGTTSQSAQRSDIRIIECITDAKGDRSRPPGKQDDPDAYVHVVERRERRRGDPRRQAAHHGRVAGHELMMIPTKAMKAGEEALRDRCAVPVNSPGVKIVNTTYAPRHADIARLPGLVARSTCPKAS